MKAWTCAKMSGMVPNSLNISGKVKMTAEESQQSIVNNVLSHGQSGGVTASTVVINHYNIVHNYHNYNPIPQMHPSPVSKESSVSYSDASVDSEFIVSSLPVFTDANLSDLIQRYGRDARFIVDRFDATVRTLKFCKQMVSVMRSAGLSVDFDPMRQGMGLPPFQGIQVGPDNGDNGKVYVQVMNI